MPNAYDCVHGGGFKVAHVRKKKIWGPQNLNFCTKEAITLPFIVVYGKL